MLLQHLTPQEARFIALIAKAAREQRDRVLGNVREVDLDERAPGPGMGEHNPTSFLGFEPMSRDTPQPAELRAAIAALSEPALQELYALMRIGQGDLAARGWPEGLADAAQIGAEATTAAIADDPDLHDHVMKGLYETRATRS